VRDRLTSSGSSGSGSSSSATGSSSSLLGKEDVSTAATEHVEVLDLDSGLQDAAGIADTFDFGCNLFSFLMWGFS